MKCCEVWRGWVMNMMVLQLSIWVNLRWVDGPAVIHFLIHLGELGILKILLRNSKVTAGPLLIFPYSCNNIVFRAVESFKAKTYTCTGVCSSECRDSQILMDEQKEKCRSEASRSVEVSSSSYKNGRGQILSPGIFAI